MVEVTGSSPVLPTSPALTVGAFFCSDVKGFRGLEMSFLLPSMCFELPLVLPLDQIEFNR